MLFSIRGLTQADMLEISGWRYAAPYNVYDESAAGLDASLYRALVDKAGTLAGVFCWGPEGRVGPAAELYASDPAPLDFGMGLRPELTGKGLGQLAAHQALQWLRDAFAPPSFRLAVLHWNLRAQKVYARLGFRPLTRSGGFLIMTLDERPWREASRPLVNGMPRYPADPPLERKLHYRKEDCGWDMTVFFMSAHSGTHIDAPAHLGLPGGTDALDLERLNGTAQLIDWQGGLSSVRSPKVLLKTGGRGLTLLQARALVDTGVQMIGLDGFSAGEGEEEMAVHRLLFTSGVLVLENAALESFAPGFYEMRCLPLHMPGSDGAPVRLQLREAIL